MQITSIKVARNPIVCKKKLLFKQKKLIDDTKQMKKIMDSSENELLEMKTINEIQQ